MSISPVYASDVPTPRRGRRQRSGGRVDTTSTLDRQSAVIAGLHALGDPTRYRVFASLVRHGASIRVRELVQSLGVGQSTISYHLKLLRDAGLVAEDDGRYSVVASGVAQIRRALAEPGPADRARYAWLDGSDLIGERGSEDQAAPTEADPSIIEARERLIRRATDRLADEFRGTFSEATIERYVRESLQALEGSRVVDFVPIFVDRFSRERLRALAQAEGMANKERPELLFVCVQNAGRSQMAAALARLLSGGRVHIRSAGSMPADGVDPVVVQAMRERGVDLIEEFPKPLTDEVVRAADVVITMGCGDACPIYPAKRYEDWSIEDPVGRPIEQVRLIRDEIQFRVSALLRDLGVRLVA
ncbi:MAG: ArsR family transcriptional regulator [Chloroflexi bacterium]|nr:ArsR family transcriptional regulator [Chloroflexota bacterium]